MAELETEMPVALGTTEVLLAGCLIYNGWYGCWCLSHRLCVRQAECGGSSDAFPSDPQLDENLDGGDWNGEEKHIQFPWHQANFSGVISWQIQVYNV